MGTLIVDAEAVDDPRLPNDSLLTGPKGTLSEVELGWIRQRVMPGCSARRSSMNRSSVSRRRRPD
jgi:hypothetical protein